MGDDYLLSEGIVALLEHRHGLTMSEGTKKAIKSIEQEFSDSLEPFIPTGLTYHVLSEEDVRVGMERLTRSEELPLVSLDDVYFAHLAHGSLSVTRLTSPNEPNKYEVGPRPGAASLDEQIENLLTTVGRQVALIDVGLFNGHTLREQVETLKRKGINVERAYVSIANAPSDGTFEVRSAYRYNFNDWVENRDLLGFDGRKPNAISDEGYLIMPYFDHLEDWASLPHSDQLRELCISYRDRIIDQLDQNRVSTTITENGSGIYQVVFNRQLQIGEPHPERT